MITNRYRDNKILILICALFCVAMNILVMDFIQDDGYITFHYADNLTNDGTLYYNSGMRGAHGYSNPLYVFILSALKFLTLKQLTFETISRIIASFSLGGILFVILKQFSVDLWNNKASFSISTIFLACSFTVFPYLLPNFFSGLETALFSFLVFLLIRFLFIAPFNEKLFLICLGIALMIRVDSTVLLMPLLIVYIFDSLNGFKRDRFKNIFILFSIIALFFVLQFSLTGTFVPLSFGHKNQEFDVEIFLWYIRFAAISLAPLAVILLRRNTQYFRFILFATFYILYTSFFYSFFMKWHFERYIFPFVFSIFANLLTFLFIERNKKAYLKITMLSFYMLAFYIPGALSGYTWVSGYRVAMLNPKKIASAFQDAQLDDSFQTYACYDAGYIAYKTGWKIIDLAGLTTPEVIHQNIEKVISENNPTVLILSEGRYIDPTMLRLKSQYQKHSATIPSNYHFLKWLRLPNDYWWPTSYYSYYVFVNENANKALTNGLETIQIEVEKEIGFQKDILLFLHSLYRFNKWRINM